MKRKGRIAVGYALCCCLAAACDPPEVCDGQSTNILADTPKAVPCSSDKLKFSPDSGVLESSALAHRTGLGGSADGSGMLPVGAAGSPNMALDGGAPAPETGDGVDTLDMALVAEDYSGQPRDTVGVDVVVCSSDSPGLATLSPAENVEECETLTASRLHCTTSPAGIAHFRLVHGQDGSGTVRVCAEAGNESLAVAQIQVLDVGVAGLGLGFSASSVGFGDASGLLCGPRPMPGACNEVMRVTPIRITALDDAGAPRPVHLEEDLTVTLTNLGRDFAFLSAEPRCAAPAGLATETEASVTIAPGSSESSPLYVCVDGGPARFELAAQPITGMLTAQVFSVPAVPAGVEVTPIIQGGEGGATGTTTETRLTVVDCDGAPLPGVRFAWSATEGSAVQEISDDLGGATITTRGDNVSIAIPDPVSGAALACSVTLGGAP